ncbi:ATP-dependent RNA helicase MAK5 [Niveomyces insectorum RCEF 264]|uniref:ATP-dependent RNA helicase n=1 Tax=Niveomyces insectorum RCEF 264 TaxID=1081102 RepID=A0A167SRW3_9HYPO|nr:ATP-dependent RNA helicase MAK5 [Niveomyces insectorum RCEF 264]
MAKTDDAHARGGNNKNNNKKRKLDKAASNAQAQKRRRGNLAAKGKLAASKPAAKPATAKPRRVMAPDELKWKPVAIPEMFDDAEGFFGLEEIQGVEIVRNGNAVQFVTSEPLPEGSDEFEGFDDAPPESGAAAGANEATNGKANGGKTKPETKAAELKAKTKKSESKENKAESRKTKEKQGKAVKVEAEEPSNEKGSQTSKKDGNGKANAKPGKKSIAKTVDDAELGHGGGFAVLAAIGADADGDEDAVDATAWAPLGVAPPLLACLAKLGFATPTPIQAAALPPILAGHDVIGKAATGSGKTLAFALPIVQAWLEGSGANSGRVAGDSATVSKKPIALVLSPTRELAHQITQHIQALCAALPTGPYVCSVTGGLSVYKQQRQLEKADIVVGTPGRLWEVLSTSTQLLAAFRDIAFLVVDEADRLLSEGHFKEAEEILLALDRKVTNEEEEEDGDDDDGDEEGKRLRQTLVFSATFNKGLQQKLAGKGRYNLMNEAQSMDHLLTRLNFREERPKFIDVNPVSQMAERLREGMVECGAMEKDLYLYALLLLQPRARTLVFTNSISSVRRLTPMLQNLNLPALPLHSQMPQKARLRSVERFAGAKTAAVPAPNNGSHRGAVLIATDVAARGLDIKGIDVVVHYHVPRTADNYVHRSGRTARAEKSGLSILLCAPEEVTPTRRLVAKIHASKGDAAAAAPLDNAPGKTPFYIRSLDIDRRLVARLRDRLVLAKTIADAALAKEKGNKDSSWLHAAADELGVEYDSADDDGGDGPGSWSGRGSGRRRREETARALTKAETGALRAELKQLLAQRVNAGVSERYLAAGGVDVEALLRDNEGDFLGASQDGLGLEDW